MLYMRGLKEPCNVLTTGDNEQVLNNNRGTGYLAGFFGYQDNGR